MAIDNYYSTGAPFLSDAQQILKNKRDIETLFNTYHFNSKGSWNKETVYNKYDLVLYTDPNDLTNKNGMNGAYYSLIDCNIKLPPLQEYWQRLTNSGMQGVPGQTGQKGDTGAPGSDMGIDYFNVTTETPYAVPASKKAVYIIQAVSNTAARFAITGMAAERTSLIWGILTNNGSYFTFFGFENITGTPQVATSYAMPGVQLGITAQAGGSTITRIY